MPKQTDSNPILKEAPCKNCGAMVQYKIAKNNRVYYYCDGAADEHQCDSNFTFGKIASRNMQKKHQQAGDGEGSAAAKSESSSRAPDRSPDDDPRRARARAINNDEAHGEHDDDDDDDDGIV